MFNDLTEFLNLITPEIMHEIDLIEISLEKEKGKEQEKEQKQSGGVSNFRQICVTIIL